MQGRKFSRDIEASKLVWLKEFRSDAVQAFSLPFARHILMNPARSAG